MGDQYRDAPYDIMCLSCSVQMPTILNVSGDNVIPRNAGQTRSLPDFDERLAAKQDEMAFMHHNKVIASTSFYA